MDSAAALLPSFCHFFDAKSVPIIHFFVAIYAAPWYTTLAMSGSQGRNFRIAKKKMGLWTFHCMRWRNSEEFETQNLDGRGRRSGCRHILIYHWNLNERIFILILWKIFLSFWNKRGCGICRVIGGHRQIPGMKSSDGINQNWNRISSWVLQNIILMIINRYCILSVDIQR